MARDKRIEVFGLIPKRSSLERINEAFQDLEAGRNPIGITLRTGPCDKHSAWARRNSDDFHDVG